MFLDKPEYCLNLSKITGVYLDPEYIFFDKPTKGMYYDSYYISNNRMIMISVLKYITLDYIHDLSYPESIKILIREFDMFISKLIDYKRNSTLQREISRNVDFF